MKKNDAQPSKGGKAACTPANTNMHKLRAMGEHPKVEVSGGKKTPA